YLHRAAHPRRPHSFPTRRSSDLCGGVPALRHPRSCEWHTISPRSNLCCPVPKPARRDLLRSPSAFPVLLPTQICCRLRGTAADRSEEHTSELQSRFDLVCRLLLE